MEVNLRLGLESTIINLVNKPQILRLGGIPKRSIKKYLKFNINFIQKIKN